MTESSRYSRIIEHVFLSKYGEGENEVAFEREDIVDAVRALNIALPKNLGDVVYSLRYRTQLPESIIAKAPPGLEWLIEGAGRAKYRFKATTLAVIEPTSGLAETKVPDATPALIDLSH